MRIFKQYIEWITGTWLFPKWLDGTPLIGLAWLLFVCIGVPFAAAVLVYIILPQGLKEALPWIIIFVWLFNLNDRMERVERIAGRLSE